jgi:hypothetical protein
VFLKKIIFFCFFLTGVVLIHSLCAGAPLMVEKNLFAQDRKPPPPESANPTPQAAKANVPISNIQLDGVMVNGNSKKALVRMKGAQAGMKKPTSPFLTVREGQQIGDFRVISIESKSMSLEKEGQKYTINLFAEGKIASPIAPQAVPVNANPNPGAADNVPVPGQPNQRANVQPRPLPFTPGQEPPAANVGVDPSQQAQGQVGIPGQVDPNVAAQDEPTEEYEE